MTCCRDCNHFEFAINPETKRRFPSMPGRCKYPVPWPDRWPDVYRWPGDNGPQRPYPAYPYPGRDASRCACFETNVKRPKSEQVEIGHVTGHFPAGRTRTIEEKKEV